MHPDHLAHAQRTLEDAGFSVLRAKSHAYLLRELAIQKQLVKSAEREARCSERWARECLTEERRLGERCTFLYGAAIAHGATPNELAGSHE